MKYIEIGLGNRWFIKTKIDSRISWHVMHS